MKTITNFVSRGTVALLSLVATIVGLFSLGVIWPLDSIDPIDTKVPILITDVSIVDVATGELISEQYVLIKAGRIAKIAPSGQLPAYPQALKVDGSGRFLMPALWDMHTHIHKVTPLTNLSLYIGYGVTNVRDLMSSPVENDPFISSIEDKKRWTEEAINCVRVGPRVVSTTSFMTNGPSVLKKVKKAPKFFGTITPEEAREFVRYYSGKVEAIKVYDRIPRASYFALADEAKRLGMHLVGHRPHAVSAIEAAENQRSIEHARFILHESFSGSEELRTLGGTPDWHEDRRRMLDEHDPQMAEAIFAAMKRSGTWYVPTHLTRQVDAYGEDPIILEDPLLRYLHPIMKLQWLEDIHHTIDRNPSPEARETYREFYRKGLELTAAAHRAGVKVLAGSDYIVAGGTLHDELQQLVLAGLSPAETLRTATTSPAEYYGLENQYGQVKTGMVADLILLNENPLEDIRNTLTIESVIFAGNLYDKAALEAIYDHVEAQARSWTVGCKILWGFIKNPIAY